MAARAFLNLLVLASLATPVLQARGDERPVRFSPVRFNRDVRPILADRCFACHGPDEADRQAGLRLDVPEGALGDRSGHPAVVPGRPDQSALLDRIDSEDDALRMPPAEIDKPLSAEERALLRRWIAAGAPYEPHWAFVPPRRPPLPEVAEADWPDGAIDRFVLARLEEAGLAPAPQADPATLLRRLSFDLTGLPPRPEDVRAFVADPSPEAYERLVDRLLDSPHYAERMAMYWLDLVRYADTVGYHGDQEHHISPYRDYVIQAFHDNMPFDRFTAEQLAGDLLPEPTTAQKIASGYNRLLQTSHEGGVQVKEYLTKYDADRVRNLSAVWMGATLGCAECHNHKYDPYTQKDFYRLAAFFADVDDYQSFQGRDASPTRREPEMDVLSPIDEARLAELEREAERLRERLAARGESHGEDGADQENERARLRERIDALSRQTRRTMITVAIEPRPTRVLARGDWMDETGEIVEPGVPHFMPQIETRDRRPTRLDLARWLTRPDHPQTARVFVNRLWYLFFGAGLSDTLDDNGAQGESPTHPELLDWLATEFVDSGWDVKHMVRLIVQSRAYRQSSRVSRALRERDPENRLFARQSRFRLPAEMIRDQALFVSGLMVDRRGGPSARPWQPAGYYQPLNFPKRDYVPDTDENQYRRGVYVHWQRQFLHPMLKAFDAPSREECTARRPISDTPTAALTLLNDPSFVEAARAFALRILDEGGGSPEERVAWAWRETLGRAPDDEERDTLARFYRWNRDQFAADPAAARALLSVGIAPQPAEQDAVEAAAWTSVARVLFNLHETVTRP